MWHLWPIRRRGTTHHTRSRLKTLRGSSTTRYGQYTHLVPVGATQAIGEQDHQTMNPRQQRG